MRRLINLLPILLALLLTGSALAGPDKAASPEMKFEFPNEPKLKSFFEAYKKSLREDMLSDFNKAQAEGMNGNPWSLDVAGSLDYKGKFWVVSISGYDYRGGAHGMPLSDAIYFDAETFEKIPQSELLTDDAYQKLSQWTRRELVDQGFDGSDEWMLSGTEPKAENFSVVLPTAKGVTVLFPPYQVAPYAAGSPTVELSWTKLPPSFAGHTGLESRRCLVRPCDKKDPDSEHCEAQDSACHSGFFSLGFLIAKELVDAVQWDKCEMQEE